MRSRCLVWQLCGALVFFALGGVARGEGHAARGIVVSTDPGHKLVTISCEEIPGYMAAMEMQFSVDDSASLTTLKPGSAVSFDIVGRGKQLSAAHISLRSGANLESEPLQAGQLSVLHRALNPGATSVAVGQPVPDFELTDQAGQRIRLSQFQGKAVLLTFGYSRCPNPNYCFRLSNNLAKVERRFQDRAGRDFVLLTIAIDPEHDQGEVLTKYAATWKADPATWHFLTGPLPEIHRAAELFGMNFWGEEGLVTHSLRTAILDKQGRLAVNLEGNSYSAQQLGDLLQTVMKRP